MVSMKPIYCDSSVPEKEAKARFFFPEFVMMENAAGALENSVISRKSETVIIFCGTGNNGGDGYALARRIFGEVENVFVISFGEPKAEEAKIQKKMTESVGVEINKFCSLDSTLDLLKKSLSSKTVIVDCIYGTGFHGRLDSELQKIIEFVNQCDAYRIACDIPSGIDRAGCIATNDSAGGKIAFCADETVTMGALKTALYSDTAKDFAGDIKVSKLGLSDSVFNSLSVPNAFLLEESDIKRPVRIKKSVHKGNFGHAAIFAGEKAGAAVIAGTAALGFGAGLVSIVQKNDGAQFIMNPELMLSSEIPEKTTALQIGSGLGRSKTAEKTAGFALDYVCKMKSPAVVLDADFFYLDFLSVILEKLNALSGLRIILTPHPKELHEILRKTKLADVSFEEVCERRLEYARMFAERFPNLVLVSKGANTYIFAEKQLFICDRGTAALAKAGSGDVLAGLCTALLAQGYSALEAAKTAVFCHAEASSAFEKNYACTPFNLIEKLVSLGSGI